MSLSRQLGNHVQPASPGDRYRGYVCGVLVLGFGLLGGARVGQAQGPDCGPAAEWSRTFGGASIDWGSSVRQTADGGYIVAGITDSFGAGTVDVYLVRTDAAGNELWSRTFGGASDDRGFSVQQTADGGYIVTGWTESFGAGGVNVYLVRTDAAGNELWSRTFGGASYDWGSSVQQTADGGYIVAGTTSSFGAGSLRRLPGQDRSGRQRAVVPDLRRRLG